MDGEINIRFGDISLGTINRESMMALYILAPAFFNFLARILNLDFIINAMYIFEIAISVYIYCVALSRNWKAIVLCYSILFILLFYSVINIPAVWNYMVGFDSGIQKIFTSYFGRLIFFCIPILMLWSCGIDLKIFTGYMERYSAIVVFLFVVNAVSTLFFSQGSLEYMNDSYLAFIPTALVLANGINNRKLFSTLMAIFSAFLIMIVGSRGAAITIIFAIFLFIILRERRTTKEIVVYLVAALVLVFAINNLDSILVNVSNFLSKLGISTRLMSLINRGTDSIFASQGRSTIYDMAREYLGIMGYGVFADRVLIGGYVHNILLELIIDFGIPVTVLLATVYLSKLFKFISITKGDVDLIIWGCIICASIFVKFMVSQSYLLATDFWLFTSILFVKPGYQREKMR